MTEITITIDELIIGGVDATAAQQIGETVTTELQRLLTQRDLALRTTHQAAIHLPLNQWPANATPAQVGVMLAQAIYKTLV